MKLSRFLAAILTAVLSLAICALAGDKETSLYNFNGGLGKTQNGIFPHNLLLESAGNLYGAALSGAEGNAGGIFELAPNGSGGWDYSLIYDCANVCNGPLGSLIVDDSGNLFGVAIGVDGIVFKLSSDGSGGWTGSLLYTFAGGTNGYDGYSPTPGLVLDQVGNLYGTNFDGGINNNGYVFELSPGGGGSYTLTHLHDFSGSDGSQPATTVISDTYGNLYGTTQGGGGSSQCTNGCGVAYELTNNSGVWTESILHDFNGPEGSSLQGTLLMDPAGNLYGTATAGGAHGFGVVFELQPSSKKWNFRDLYAFKSGASDGAAPYENLLMDAAGNLYGTTWSGGGGDCSVGSDAGCGTAFELTHIGSKWSESVLHTFTGGGDGAFPEGVIFTPGGGLYGVAPSGGGLDGGLVYELSPPAANKESPS